MPPARHVAVVTFMADLRSYGGIYYLPSSGLQQSDRDDVGLLKLAARLAMRRFAGSSTTRTGAGWPRSAEPPRIVPRGGRGRRDARSRAR